MTDTSSNSNVLHATGPVITSHISRVADEPSDFSDFSRGTSVSSQTQPLSGYDTVPLSSDDDAFMKTRIPTLSPSTSSNRLINFVSSTHLKSSDATPEAYSPIPRQVRVDRHHTAGGNHHKGQDQEFFGASHANPSSITERESLESELGRPLLTAEPDVDNPKGSGPVGTFFTFVKSFVGVGILFLPKGFHNGGLAFSTTTLSVVASLSYYTMLELMKCSDLLGGASFGEVGRGAAGWWGEFLVNLPLCLSQIGFCCTYYIFIAEHVQEIFLPDWSMVTLILLQIPLIAPITWVRRVSRLEICSTLGTILVLFGVGYILVHSCNKIATDGAEDVKMLNSSSYALFFGTASYTFEGTAVVLLIRNNAKRRKDFGPLLIQGMVFILVLFTLFGALGYLAYGDDVESPVTLNISDENNDDNDDDNDDDDENVPTMVRVTQILYCLAAICTFPLMMFPAIEILETVFKFRKHETSIDGPPTLVHQFRKNAFRSLVCVVCACIALAGSKNFDNFISLIGALCCVPLAFQLPAYFHYVLVSKNTPSQYMDFFLFMFGSVVMVMATYQAISQW